MSKIIFTNGCFDIIHSAHIKLLEFCKSLGGQVIVGLNSDASVRQLKGSRRPINSQQDRKTVLEAIRYVDQVMIFDELTPLELIKKISPDIIVKGGDYTPQEVVGREFAEVIIFNYIHGKSTTLTIEKCTLDR